MSKIIIGVMGPGELATPIDIDYAEQLGKLIAENSWVLLTGGRNVGVMNAASLGAKSGGGLTVGILPDRTTARMSEFVDLAIMTDLGNARNNINVLSATVIVACGMGAGTASEIALALKQQKKVILLNADPVSQQFFSNLSPENIVIANDPENAIALIKSFLAQ
ncbi:P450 cytochrome [Stanieria sp. NIES-3757]|nr:P450 cytochrome [Stanieria sp. NIES-3757]